MPSTRALVLVALVLFAFWRPLFAGGTLAPDDQLWLSDPFNADPPAGLTIEVAERDAATIHGWWAGWAEDLRSGDLSWWRDVGAGEPVLAEGLPITHLAYLLVPDWYAPGLVAALAVLLAAFGAMRLSDRLGLAPIAGLLSGIAFGFSGLMFAWIGWPHATAIALAPWVVSAVLGVRETRTVRSIVGAAVAIALQLWCGVFAIAAFTLLGVAAWLGFEAIRCGRRGGLLGASGSVALGAMLAAPHLWPRWERWSWADTAHLETAGDTSAPLLTAITAMFGSGFGNESVGVQWFESGSFQLSVGFVGATTVVAVLVGLLMGRVAGGVIIVGLLGVAVAYVGGPFDALSDLVAGSGSLASHARVLFVLALALAAGAGADALVTGEIAGVAWRERLRSAVIPLGVAALVVLVVTAGWLDVLRDGRGLRAVAAQSVATVVVAAIASTLVMLCTRRRLAGGGVAIAFVALAAYELLTFGMPIPTVTDRDERPTATSAHDALLAVLDDHGRVAGDHDAFSPADAARFGIADVRAPGLRSPAEVEAFAAVDPSSMFAAVGGGPFAPVIRVRDDADPFAAPLWDTLGVDAWVLPRDAAPPGRRVDPIPQTRSTLAATSPIGMVIVPEHGLRAVVIDLASPAFTTVALEVEADGVVVTSSTVIRRALDGPVAAPIAGELLPAGATARVIVTVDAGDQPVEVGTTDGSPALGTIGGAPDDELVWTDGALVIARPTPRVWWDGSEDAGLAVVTEQADRLVVDVRAPGGGTLVSDLIGEPGWTIDLDGEPVSASLIDDLVLGVEVPEGTHTVEFSYRPPRFGSGLLVALLGIVIAGVAMVGEVRRGSRAA